MSNQENISRAEYARAILDNPIWNDSFATLRSQIIDEWSRTPATQPNRMVELRHLLGLVDDVQRHLHRVIVTGKQAELALQSEAEAREAEELNAKFNS